ncbi:hypothetical protein ACJQWK_08682 [Exserohilum turcicum]
MQFGREALAHCIKGIVYVCSHWVEEDDRIRVSTGEHPQVTHMELVPRRYWENYPINVSPELGRRVVSVLKAAGLPDVDEDPNAQWHDDTLTPSRWMFPEGNPPATCVSINARYDPIVHIKLGRALRPLRSEGILIVGSGAITHNLFRASWAPVLRSGLRTAYHPNYKPEKWVLDFERAVRDSIMFNSGPRLAGALVRLLDHPCYKLAHPSDDHFYPLIVIAGVVSGDDDTVHGRKMAESWDVGNVCSSQYLWGSWSGET